MSCCNSKGLRFKRGDTLALECVRLDANGAPVAVGSVASWMRRGDSANHVAWTVDVQGGVGRYFLRMTAAQSADLLVGDYLMDIEYTDAGIVSSTETIAVFVDKDITNAN